jgi:photosystem II stability/assembly factor-like uncharacterized protein
VQKPDSFVMAAAGGGIWRTDNAGRTWTPLFDKGPTAPVGAIAIAPSNPDIIYAGTGQPTPRYDVAGGAGVFRSDDGGQHWTPLGLTDTRHIGRIWVDPLNPDHVLVAAVGHFFGPNPARGVFTSTDGGKTWLHSLKIDNDTGAVDLAADPADPKVIFATSWQARQMPWMSYYAPVAGKGSGLWRSDDGGASWHRLTGEGWPSGALGRISVAATRTPSGLRLYAVISAGAASGLYRSDDAGGHWTRVNDDQAFTSYYANHVAVTPNDPDVVYLVGQSIRRCDQGGASCAIIKGAPGGDDYHFIWLNPTDPKRWATASDQGTVITVDGGKTFSSWYNQPTAQFYHLATDNRFPYRIFSGQQDSGTAMLASRSDYGAPNFRDWRPVGGDERDFVIPDPEDPSIVYATGLGGRLSRYDDRTGQVANIAPFLAPNYGKRQISVEHHYVWITPMAISRTGPVTLYVGAESVFMSKDRGQSWTSISPDLTGKSMDAKNCDGDVTVADARACGYGGIWSMISSARHPGELWVGTDSGLLQMTQDDGAHWTDVTPPGLPAWAKIASIELSENEDGTAYIVVDNQRQDDFTPRAFATHDKGKSWREIGKTLPAGHFASVLRVDPHRPGLLFAGTETGVFASLDDGDHWTSLQQNLPTAWIRDLAIHGDDLIAATQGRSIWILDDIAPLREFMSSITRERAHLFAPATAFRVRPNNNKDTPLPPEEPVGENPPAGAIIDYWLATPAKSIALEIRDSSGSLVQVLSDKPLPSVNKERYFADEWVKPPHLAPLDAGLHRLVWDARWTRPNAIAFKASIAATAGQDTPVQAAGAWALPGVYQVTLLVDGTRVGKQSLTLLPDPRSKPDMAELQASLSLSRLIADSLAEARRSLRQSQALAEQVKALKPNDPALSAALQQAVEWGQATEALPGLSDQLTALEEDLETTDRRPTDVQRTTAGSLTGKISAQATLWQAHLQRDLPALNGAITKAGLKPVKLPDGNQGEITLSDDGEDLP